MTVKTFRTKPVQIEAVEWTGDNYEEIKDFVGYRDSDAGYKICYFQRAGEYGVWIHRDGSPNREITGEVYDELHSTWVGVKTGQWIIKGTKGEFYPCDPETFEWKYEEVWPGEESEIGGAEQVLSIKEARERWGKV